MPKMSLGEAAKASRMAKTTLRRAIDSGKISAEKTEHGHYLIDPSELGRFMDAQKSALPVAEQVASSNALPPDFTFATPLETPQNSGSAEHPHSMQLRVMLAEQKAELLAAQIEGLRKDQERDQEDFRESLADLRRDRDAWRSQAERLLIEASKKEADPSDIAALTPTPEPPIEHREEKRVGFWRRLLGV